jgi:CheY-like chemotaxis protein
MHALIIEDQFIVATLVEDVLRDLGYKTFDRVESDAEAIAAAMKRCPELITADQRLTDGTGVNAVRAICNMHPIPVVFVTGYPGEVLELVPDAVVIAKPFAVRTLREAVLQAKIDTVPPRRAAE